MNKFLYDVTAYNTYRPQYPGILFEYFTECVDQCGVVLDCGTGTGQGAQKLSSYFRTVIASDLSFELLSKAKSLPNVYYLQSSAEQLPIGSTTIDLICVAQAIHWFPLNDFYREVNRVLKPGGVLAAWCYNQAVIEPAVDQVIKTIYLKITSAQNPSRERQYLYDHYQCLPFPFKRLSTPSFKMEMNWNLLQLSGYISTWPGLLEYQKKFNVDLLTEIKNDLVAAWGDPLSKKLITWPIYMLVGRQSLSKRLQ